MTIKKYRFPKGEKNDPIDYKGGRDLESLAKFVSEKSGVPYKVKQEKSVAVPLTTESFDEIVYSEGMNVLVEFYAP